MFTLRKKRVGALLVFIVLIAAVFVWSIADTELAIALNGSDRVEIDYGET